jgi:hypothetical protein
MATTTIEVELENPDNNFLIEPGYTYGEITIAFLLIVLIAVVFFRELLDITKK